MDVVPRASHPDDLEDLFENAPCGYLSTGLEGRITRANRTLSDWLRIPATELERRKFQDLLTLSGKIYYETHFAPLLKMQGFFNEVALDLTRSDGTTLPALVNAVERQSAASSAGFIRITVFDASDRRRYERELVDARKRAERTGEQLARLNDTLEQRVLEEVTKRLKAEEALHQAQKMEALGQLTGGIAHDFNNMLAGVIGALNLMQRRLHRGELDVEPLIEGALDSAYRAAALTQRLLSFSRRQPLAPVALDINRLASGMTELLARTLGEMIHVETVLGAGLWSANADPSQLENVILNLAVNARDAMPKGGRLTIETSNAYVDEIYARDNHMVEGQYVLIAVSDTGSGIPKEILARVFDPFFTTKPVGKGTGLGLSQVHGFARQSGGNVKIYSELGRGTTVKLYLPRNLSQADPEQLLEPHRDTVEGGTETILVVEDDDRVRHFATEALRELGYSVLEAASGAVALDAIRDHGEIKLLFTDVVMPEMSGRELVDRAKKFRPELRTLYCTGYTRNAIVHNGVLDPGTQLLQKPYSFSELARKVRALLDS